MIDLYLCTIADKTNSMRMQMATLCLARWQQEPGVKVRLISPEIAKCSPTDFQRQRRIYADEHADSEIYIVADDDCLPQATPFAVDCAALLKYHTEFRILSLLPSNAKIQPWTPATEYRTEVNTQVMEHISVGGIRFCRKYIIANWPSQHGLGYDMAQAEAIRKIGRRVGYFQDYKMNHLGEGYSTVWRANE